MKLSIVISTLLLCACFQAAAEVGQKPFPKIEGGSLDEPPPRPRPAAPIFNIPANARPGGICAAEIEQTVETQGKLPKSIYGTSAAVRGSFEGDRDRILSRTCSEAASDIDYLEKHYTAEINSANNAASSGRFDDVRGFRAIEAEKRTLLCLYRARVAQCNGSSLLVPARPAAPAIAAPSVVNPAGLPLAEARRVNEALANTMNNQEKVDKARAGRPKLHKSGSVAHDCIKPRGGGWVNACPYAIEYSYCVYRPVIGSSSAAFDCENGKIGSWQSQPGRPEIPILIHTEGLIPYWFACRYGETLSKPDGISPVDIEYQRGRGLLGRCGEWGSSTRK